MQALSEDENPEEIFDILLPIGEGAYGSVYKALDNRDGHLVALKIMPLETESVNLEAEVSIMKRCNSPYIVNFKGAFLKDDNIWLAMEYCGAGSVIDIMRATNKMFTENEICVVMREILYGLMYLHSHKLIHRDIKSGNILLNMKGQCKLADFGISKAFENTIAACKTVIGTPYWMAPEIFTDGKYNTKADVWSLGVVLFCMAIGAPPYKRPNTTDECFNKYIKKGHIAQLLYQWKRHSYVTERMLSLLKSMLKYDENNRFSMDDVIQHPWLRTYYSKYYQLIKNDLLAIKYAD
eukprot:310539_1